MKNDVVAVATLLVLGCAPASGPEGSRSAAIEALPGRADFTFTPPTGWYLLDLEQTRQKIALVDFGALEVYRTAIAVDQARNIFFRKYPDSWPGYAPNLLLSVESTPGLTDIEGYATATIAAAVRDTGIRPQGRLEMLEIAGLPASRQRALISNRYKDGRTFLSETEVWYVLGPGKVVGVYLNALPDEIEETIREIEPTINSIRFTTPPAPPPP